MTAQQTFPVFVICRDRLTPLLELIAWLEKAGQREIYLVDNASTYPPLLEDYKKTSYFVFRLPENVGARVLWRTPIIEKVAQDRFYVVSDPDIIPARECPLGAFDRFYELLQKYPQMDKAGFGLRIDDLPSHYAHKDLVIRWERQFWNVEVEPGVYAAPIDTTLMLCRPLAQCTRALGLRTGAPYVARHTAWYLDFDNLDEEELYYQKNARKDVTNWNFREKPGWMEDLLNQAAKYQQGR
jgi:hypothetical protein